MAERSVGGDSYHDTTRGRREGPDRSRRADLLGSLVGGRGFDDPDTELGTQSSFVPRAAVEVAADKRAQATLFREALVPMPETVLVDSAGSVREFVTRRADRRWVLKYPIGCGAAGHHFVTVDWRPRADWPTPFVVQEFIEMDDPAVYRVYCAGEELFGWNVRRFSAASARRSPFVAHAMGASYEVLGRMPPAVEAAAQAALAAAGLWGSFGCVDLLESPRGWLVLEVGTDGRYNYVDRAVPEPLATELDRRIAVAMWTRLGEQPPWGRTWCRRSQPSVQ